MITARCETFEWGWEVTIFRGERLEDRIVWTGRFFHGGPVYSANGAIKAALNGIPVLDDVPEQR